ncbi:SDR family NAD(P)-dependent oxidoreductase [soil metagenome]
MRFSQKVIWITGASSGIGEALAYAFYKEGANLILSARNELALVKISENCGDAQRVKILPLDLSQTNMLQSRVITALEHYGKIDILINNAGIAQNYQVINTNEEVIRKIMEVNFFGTVLLSNLLIPLFIQSGGGHLVIISSLSGKFGVPKLSSYSASKHALHGYFNSMRTEVHQKNIRITILVPGYIKTSIAQNALVGDGRISGRNLEIMKRGMDPEKCAIEMVNAIYKKKEEDYIGNKEILSVYFYRFFPKLFNKVIRNHPVKRLRKILKGSK